MSIHLRILNGTRTLNLTKKQIDIPKFEKEYVEWLESEEDDFQNIFTWFIGNGGSVDIHPEFIEITFPPADTNREYVSYFRYISMFISEDVDKTFRWYCRDDMGADNCVWRFRLKKGLSRDEIQFLD